MSAKSHFDDLPKRDNNDLIEDAAVVAFQQLLSASRAFHLQRADRKDYGTDCQIEVSDGGAATNVRVHVQLKGTEKALRDDGSFTVQVPRANLNYLFMNPHSFYVGYHVPTDTLRFVFVDAVLRDYAHRQADWAAQKTITISFDADLTVDVVRRLAALARSSAVAERGTRAAQVLAGPDDVAAVVRASVPIVYVPSDPHEAAVIAERLYDSGENAALNAAFGKFESVVGADHDVLGFCYMAAINLGMEGTIEDRQRIEDAIAHFRARLRSGRFQAGSLHYSIGNGLSALGDEEAAKAAFEAALADPAFASDPALAAQGHKNLGTSFERSNDQERALTHYREALRLDPNLAEAHCAMGSYYHRVGQYEDALTHFDHVVISEAQLGRFSRVAGWRINVLFNLGDGRAAFRDINAILGDGHREAWIWPWCARQVALFGRATVDNARRASVFWQRYVAKHPDVSAARREYLLANFFLRSHGEEIGKTFAEFSNEFDEHVGFLDVDDAALAWDRLGHWAQDDENWREAERCFRKAYDAAGGHFGYCLGTALNFLGRCEESLPLLLEQAERIQPDPLSWFQVGAAHAELGNTDQAVIAYRKAIELDPDYALAWFNLGGVHWNDCDMGAALTVWQQAVTKFPDHEMAARVRALLPLIG